MGKKKDKRNIDQLIFDISEHNRRADYNELCRRLPKFELFSPLVVDKAEDAKPKQSENSEVKFPTIKLPNDMVMLLFFASKRDPRLGDPYMGMPAKKALEMALEEPGVDGLILHNSKDSWVAFPKEGIQQTLEEYF